MEEETAFLELFNNARDWLEIILPVLKQTKIFLHPWLSLGNL